MTKLIAFLKNDSGVTAMEYAFIGALIFVVIFAAVQGMGDEMPAPYENMATGLQNANAHNLGR